MNFTDQQIEAGAKAARDAFYEGDPATPWHETSERVRRTWIEAQHAALEAAFGDGGEVECRVTYADDWGNPDYAFADDEEDAQDKAAWMISIGIPDVRVETRIVHRTDWQEATP